MKKILLYLLICSVLLPFFSCAHAVAPSTGITINCALIGYGDYEKLYETITEFERQTGHKVNIIYLDNHFELDKKLKRDFAAGTVDYDVVSNHSSFFTQYVDYLEPLNPYFTELNDFIPRLLDCGKKDGNLYLLPRHADISSILYRTDLFNDPTNQQAYFEQYGRQLAPPQTWEE
ncbi:MAG: ABC transporter substrate-binding protein, partial [Lacrimispora sphenoides]